MLVTVLFFARAREITCVEADRIELVSGGTVADVEEAVLEKYPRISDTLRVCAWARNEEYVNDKMERVGENDTLAIIPPISGG
mmetsp:Transcript_12189/g.19822  ORF Transcript_12189/g.19822 Transcript_12189/m.19822 type:complete len:83 (-) Transcript_12189:381-629(-)|eukprot:CAMPEP_0203784676 /NCGR_PEP_ID=MMETSP0100_2-20121128/596_1 /ASSEMBLY_ACC=CAM_ASM_000210 /TAXON_ID=96639 /ORGANISM=" , Strain NY0313808BC1" /LENGTH=82 /DNA_ID=CAMNT_0050686679 /DNA_START=188 /DNA_END=436 /DNA_ORIENTATION=-